MTEEQIKSGFSSALPYIYAAGMYVPMLTFNFGIAELNQAALLGFCGVGALKFYLGYKKLQYMSTPEYREYIDLYNEYVSDIALMLDELGFKSDFSAAIAYKYCLNLGIFSSETYEYTIYENDRERVLRYSGARVATGACCCRHNASLLSDILIQRGVWHLKFLYIVVREKF